MKAKAELMNVTWSLRMGLVVAAAIFLQHSATAQTIPAVNYGTADSFAILAGTTITDVQGPTGGTSTIVKGDVGVYPGSANQLTASQVLSGAIYSRFGDDTLLLGAKNALSAAFTVADAIIPIPGNVLSAGDNQLGSQTLGPGVYQFGGATTANLIGTLVLDPQGATNPVWIFQATSTLVTASGSKVVLLGNATPCDVLWQVDSSATLGTGTEFYGTIMAYASIGLNTNATLVGRAWAETGAVTLDHNTITGLPCTSLGGTEGGGTGVPDGGSTLLLLGSGLAALVGFRRRFRSQV